MIQQENTMSILLDQLKDKNPKRYQLINQLMQQQQPTKTIEVAQKRGVVNTKTAGQMKRLININKQLKHKIQKLLKEKENLLQYLDFFVEINNEFSKAVGACACFGLDENCECKRTTSSNERGVSKGGPGSYPINKELFNAYVAPCLSNDLLRILSRKA